MDFFTENLAMGGIAKETKHEKFERTSGSDLYAKRRASELLRTNNSKITLDI